MQYLDIHSSTVFHFPSSGNSFRRESLTSLFLATFSSSSCGAPGQKGYIISPAYSGLLPVVCAQKTSKRMPEPTQLTPFDTEEQWLYSKFSPDGQAPHPISKAEPSHFSCLYPWPHSFDHYPDLMNVVKYGHWYMEKCIIQNCTISLFCFHSSSTVIQLLYIWNTMLTVTTVA